MRNKGEADLMTMGRRAKVGHELLKLLYRQPAVNVSAVTNELKLSHVAADRLLRAFVERGILHEITGFKRNRLFQFKDYFDLFANG